MKVFADTADLEEISALHHAGLIDGVTTNPSLLLKSGRPIGEVLAEICRTVSGSVSAEVVATDFAGMMREAELLAAIADNVCIKLPLTLDGLRACGTIRSRMQREVNVTLCFSATQALLAAKAGASFISPFIGRLDDTGIDGMSLIRDIRTIYNNYGFQTQILAASARTVNHIKDAALIGADVVTAPPFAIKALVRHPLTDSGLAQFLADWAKTGQSIG
ncbi:MAG: fructose-6-phosphate aldolase [Rhizobiaceae bacterium]